MYLTAHFLRALKGRTLQRPFARGCKIVLIVWLFGVFIPLNLILENHAQYGASRKWTPCFPNADFSQYYIAGVAARYNLWSHLYPKFKPEWASQPGRKIWSSEYAEADPEILTKISGLPTWYVENIAPPPQAIFCIPLGYFSFVTAFKIWMTCLIFATFGTMVCAVKVYQRLGGASGYVEGAIYLSGVFIPLLPRIGAGDNAMMFLVFCIGLAALSWVDNRPFTLGISLIVPAVFKGLTASWCPLLFVKPIKWQTVGWMAAWTILLNGLVLFWGGVHPYTTWLHDILPNAQSMEVQQYWHHCMNLKGIAYLWGWESFPASYLKGFYLAGLLAIYLGFWKQRNTRGSGDLANICAAMVAALVLFNLLNTVSWLPYITFLLPFAGWAVMEYSHCSPPEKMLMKILAGTLFILVPIVHWLFSHFVLKYAQAATDACRDMYLGVELLFLVLAYRLLFCAPPAPCGNADENRQGQLLKPKPLASSFPV